MFPTVFPSLPPAPLLSLVGRQIFYTEAARALLPSQVSLPPPHHPLRGCHRWAVVDVFILQPQTRVNAVILGFCMCVKSLAVPRVIPDADAVQMTRAR